jgi:hypothetical protein
MGKLRGLGFKMAGNPEIKPALDLGGQIKDFDSHGKVLCKFPCSPFQWPPNRVTPILGAGLVYSIAR